ncbi:MAG: hypothetical protein MI892_16235 [Desulfobacterales bacterium]|nr:hypothetical protein [Desulfobacterales bacterium]
MFIFSPFENKESLCFWITQILRRTNLINILHEKDDEINSSFAKFEWGLSCIRPCFKGLLAENELIVRKNDRLWKHAADCLWKNNEKVAANFFAFWELNFLEFSHMKNRLTIIRGAVTE